MDMSIGSAMSTRYRLVDLKPGEIHVADRPTFITTLLGSCVSVCLYSVRDSAGAMSHSVLPVELSGSGGPDVRYVEIAIEKMLDDLNALGVPTRNVRAKMFGGAEMFKKSESEIRLARIVGDGNTLAAREFLKARGIDLVSECVGGNCGRKLIFNTATGVVFVRKFMGGQEGSANRPFSEHAA